MGTYSVSLWRVVRTRDLMLEHRWQAFGSQPAPLSLVPPRPAPGPAHLSRCSADSRRQRVLSRLRVSTAANWRI